MGLNSSMQKLLNYTQKVNDVLNPNKWLSMRVPGIKGGLFKREEGEGISTLGDLLNEINTSVGDIMTGVNIAYCAVTMGGAGYADFIGKLATGVVGAITAVADTIMDAIYIQISNAVNQIVNLISGFLDMIFNVWSSICQIYDAMCNWWDSFGDFFDFNFDNILAKQNCSDMYAAIGACLLNKFLGPYLDEFKEKATDAINKHGKKMNDIIYEELADARTFVAYANQEAFLLKKAALQINGLTRENLIGDVVGQ